MCPFWTSDSKKGLECDDLEKSSIISIGMITWKTKNYFYKPNFLDGHEKIEDQQIAGISGRYIANQWT